MRKKLQVKLKDRKNATFLLPDYQGVMECIDNESLMFFGWETFKSRTYRHFFGIGRCYRVVKGENIDYLWVNFGMNRKHTRRCIRVIDNHSRRQLLTLKRGHVCMVYGVAMFYIDDKKLDKGVHDLTHLPMYAKGVQGWYVPTQLEIKKMVKNGNIEQELFETNTEKENNDEIRDILDMFKGNE